METTNHILAKEGILVTFSIAKRVTPTDMKRLRGKVKATKMDKDELHDLLRQSVMEETQRALIDNKIPGLIVPGQNVSEEEKRKMMENTYFSSVIAKKINERHIDKFHSCYIINAIVNMLGLTEDDFEEFHRKFSDRDEPDTGSDTSGAVDGE